MIIQNFFGGIGNQLFQYAAAYSLSLKIKKKYFTITVCCLVLNLRKIIKLRIFLELIFTKKKN